jgi:hypothetical protein
MKNDALQDSANFHIDFDKGQLVFASAFRDSESYN